MLTPQQAASYAADRFVNAATEILRGVAPLSEAVDREARADERARLNVTIESWIALAENLQTLHSIYTDDTGRAYCRECGRPAPCSTSEHINQLVAAMRGEPADGLPGEAPEEQQA